MQDMYGTDKCSMSKSFLQVLGVLGVAGLTDCNGRLHGTDRPCFPVGCLVGLAGLGATVIACCCCWWYGVVC